MQSNETLSGEHKDGYVCIFLKNMDGHSSRHHFHYSQVKLKEFFHMSKERNGFNDWGYCHIDSQRGGIPTQVQARRWGSEGGVEGVGLN